MIVRDFSLSSLPKEPAVCALLGGRGRTKHVAYVGIADSLRDRVKQHLVRKDSSVVTGTSAVSLDPELVTEIHWWIHPRFADRSQLEASELIASELLEPALRSRGTPSKEARSLYEDISFRNEMQLLFSRKPSGQLRLPTFQDVPEMMSEMEKRISVLEKQSRRERVH